jgi:hypothetical protein
VNQIKLFYF